MGNLNSVSGFLLFSKAIGVFLIVQTTEMFDGSAPIHAHQDVKKQSARR